MDLIELGERVKAARKSKGWSQTKLAQTAGISRARLEALGCSSEQWSAERPFLAVDVPPEVEIRAVVEVLDEGESQGAWGWETGLLGNGHRSRWPAS